MLIVTWAPIIVAVLSLTITALAWLSRRPLDRHQLAKMRREQIEADERRNRERTEEDEKRNRSRVEADERRADRLRDELDHALNLIDELSKSSNRRFSQWQEAVNDLDELWSYMEDQMLPYQRRAYGEIRRLDPESSFGLPPPLPRRHRQPNGSNGDG